MIAREVMRKYLEAMRSGDREAAFSHYSEDIVGHVPGRSSRAGELRGKDAVVGYIRAVVAHASEGVEVELIDMLARGARGPHRPRAVSARWSNSGYAAGQRPPGGG